MAVVDYDDAQRKLAYTLLLELMSYQFASPVRWIETQDVVLSQYRAERIVEIGPAATLTNMMAQTVKSKFLHSDRASLLKRQLLASEKQGKEIYYEYDAPVAAAAEAPVPASLAPEAAITKSVVPEAVKAPTPVAVPVPEAVIDDQPARAFEVIRTLLSRVLKIAVTDIVGTQSIKSLAGGRSTLENEIIGDLNSEFGSLPDRAEDLTVTDLSDALQKTFTGQMRKVMLKMLHAMFASKMPGQFTVATTRAYLQSRWGLGSGRQDSILLLAIAQQPASRISEEPEAKIFFDGLVQVYATEHGLTLGGTTGGGAEETAGGHSMMLDHKTLEALTGGQQELSKALLKLYSKHLDIDLDQNQRALDDLQVTVEKDLRKALDQIQQELGEDFTSGVQPQFSAKKARRFDSAWSWALQDLLHLYYEVSRGGGEGADVLLATKRCEHIQDAADPRLVGVLQHIVGKFTEQPLLSSLFTRLAERCRESLHRGPKYLARADSRGPCTTISAAGDISYSEHERAVSAPLADLVYLPCTEPPLEPYLHLKERTGSSWRYSHDLTEQYHAVLEQATTTGESFVGRAVLITGAGVGSIGAEVLKGLLSGGARVIVTTSRFSPSVVRKYQDLYAQFGARESELVVVPFNQASSQDISALVDYIYDTKGLHWDLDHILPFAAIPENGRTIEKIDPHAELAHRTMMTNTLRLLGAVKSRKEAQDSHTRPTQVILPLSPNHGIFGGDGLYSESKLGLEALFNRWHSEDWSDYLSVCGAVIGWTRGTGLMSGNNLVAEGIERLGCRTFSQQEMAQCLLCLMFNPICSLCEEAPLYADLAGRMGAVQDLRQKVQELRAEISETAQTRKALLEELDMEAKCSSDATTTPTAAAQTAAPTPVPKAHVRLDFPEVLDYDRDIRPLTADLQGMVDLERIVVVTGFAELGPWGNARTRWEMEAYGEFSLEGCVEMAWLMGLIRYENGTTPGWVDAKTNEPVLDHQIKQKYEEHILAHSGIRLIEPDLFGGYDPERKQTLHEVLIQEDFPPLEVPETTAQQLKLEHGDKVHIAREPGTDQYRAVLKKGAKLLVPKAMRFDRLVAGQIPTGWDAKKYGISDDLISQVDAVALYTLVCSIESLLSSGITDPYEIYRYIHISEAGNCIGSGIGGTNSLQQMYRDRYHEKEVQKDILQESFVNTIGAWVNMLLMSSAGPMRTPVGACATAIESVELGYDTLVSGKAQFCFVGGGDDFGEEMSYEFANMKATSNAVDEFEQGRDASEMSRPAASTRNGFMESHGCGIQILTTAKLALEMGLPVRGVIAFVETSSDKASRSVPAPGKGILSKAREAQSSSSIASPLLKLANRRKRLEFRKKQINFAREAALEDLQLEVASLKSSEDVEAYIRERTAQIEAEARKDLKNARYHLGNTFWADDPTIAPLRGALAVWGLGVDDLGVASFHGTSTKLNEKNECGVIQRQLSHLGRAKGNVILGVFQKYLTGHPKGAAGAWMLNGALQILDTGIVPGNRNLDNVDAELQQNEHIAFLNRSLETTGSGGIRAISVTSFGFGQKGAQTIVVHPKYLFATLEGEQEYQMYVDKRTQRQKKADAFFYRGLAANSLFELKTATPWAPQKELETLLDPTVRF
ncbi:fatty-acid synthase alpha chain [Aspergillus uvarum CBS 121591]|uniref:Fatty acid synthase subunit alpha n=1 Tax=Aspergillus uvarum CBS 121591 TaxID=1448315 RepID=A0A319CKH7_9EURO|nr:fatty-acid synthase alpha chain [Aspergillus uvarum CBS 121591]PYH86086.1 fatty-acid synthase alpha chain [Aspergillus uvarum CBS 121591]